MFKSGEPRLLKFHWSACKIAHLRDGAKAESRPALGRKPDVKSSPDTSVPAEVPDHTDANNESGPALPKNKQRRRRGQLPAVANQTNANHATSSHENDSLFNDPPMRIARSTRNPAPNYVD